MSLTEAYVPHPTKVSRDFNAVEHLPKIAMPMAKMMPLTMESEMFFQPAFHLPSLRRQNQKSAGK